MELGRPDWPDSSIIYRVGPDEPNLGVVGFIEADDPEFFDVLMLELG
jgi:hypothetical protein